MIKVIKVLNTTMGVLAGLLGKGPLPINDPALVVADRLGLDPQLSLGSPHGRLGHAGLLGELLDLGLPLVSVGEGLPEKIDGLVQPGSFILLARVGVSQGLVGGDVHLLVDPPDLTFFDAKGQATGGDRDVHLGTEE